MFSNRDNCEKESAKVFRQYYRRPYFLPPMAEAVEGNWFIVSSGENKTLNVSFSGHHFDMVGEATDKISSNPFLTPRTCSTPVMQAHSWRNNNFFCLLIAGLHNDIILSYRCMPIKNRISLEGSQCKVTTNKLCLQLSFALWLAKMLYNIASKGRQ